MSFLNPFRDIIESEDYPSARTLRTDFNLKLADTYDVYAGSSRHVGLFDYATLMLPLALITLTDWGLTKLLCQNPLNPLAIMVTIVTIIPTLITLAARYLTSAVFTLLSVPIVGIVQGFASIKANELKNKIKSITVTPSSSSTAGVGSALTLGAHLKNRHTTLDDYLINDFRINGFNTVKNSYDAIELKLTKKVFFNGIDISYTDATTTLNLLESKDQQVLKAMFQLNFGGITQYVKQDTLFSYVLKENKIEDIILANTYNAKKK